LAEDGAPPTILVNAVVVIPAVIARVYSCYGGSMDLLLGLVFGGIGSGYLIYAKRQYSAMFAVAGAALIIYPYFLTNVLAIVLVGALIAAAPFAWQRWGG